MEEKILCVYGCGQEAKFKITKKKVDCCSETWSKCPENRKKNSEGLKKDHALNPKDYSNREMFGKTSGEWRIKNPDKYKQAVEKQKKTYRERYDAGLIVGSNKGKHHTQETKDKIRISRINYLKTKSGKTAWEKRASGEFSYLEKWFYENVILKNDLEKKYDIINEFCETPYFIDFAFINESIAVELDGACHFNNGTERMEHDIKKDSFLKEKGWIVYRVAYFELKQKDVEKEFLEFLNSKDKKQKEFSDNLINYKEWKSKVKPKENKNRKEYLKKVRLQNHDKEKENIEKVLNVNNIDFSKIGWVKQVALLIGKKEQKVNEWIKKYLPEFYQEKCFKRKQKEIITEKWCELD